MLFKTDAEIQSVLSFVNNSFKLNHITGRIQDVERKFIKDVLGSDEYTSLHTNYNVDSLTVAQTALLPYVQSALALLAFLDHIPYLNVDVGAGGLRVAVNKDRVAASQYRTEDLKSQVARDGYNALESLLQFLWDNATDYTDWNASTSKAKYRKYFINTANEFSEFVDINNSHYLFWRMKANINYVEQTYIKALICNDLFDAIKAEIVTGSISANNEVLMGYIRPAVANLAFVQAISTKGVQLDGDSVSEKYKSNFGNTAATNPARDTSIRQVIDIHKKNGEDALKELKDYLYANHATYATWESSDCYDSEEETGNVSIISQNDEDDKIVIL